MEVVTVVVVDVVVTTVGIWIILCVIAQIYRIIVEHWLRVVSGIYFNVIFSLDAIYPVISLENVPRHPKEGIRDATNVTNSVI